MVMLFLSKGEYYDMPREFKFDVEQQFGTLSKNEANNGNVYSKEVNLISYNEANPVYDIRNWTTNSDGERRMGKGITLNLEELKELKSLLNEMEDLKED